MLTFAALAAAIPAVVLSGEHQAMIKVAVGDEFPNLSGQSAAGEDAQLANLLGEKATVVATPGRPEWMLAMMRQDLAEDFAPKYAEQGVSFLSLGAGVEADAVTKLGVDPAALANALGDMQTPNVFVLNADGEIVWFDVEYTLATHRELHATLDELIGEKLAE